MINVLTLALTHGLMAIAALILAGRADLDDDGAGRGEAGGKPLPRWKRRGTAGRDSTGG